MVGTALVVPLILAFVWSGSDGDMIGLAVTALVGGPHLFATFLATWGDRDFRKKHLALLIGIGTVIPAMVTFLALAHFQLLMSLFIFAASIHVLHQNAYLTDQYRRRSTAREPAYGRFLDYAVLMLSMYPIAAYKLVNHDFWLAGMPVIIPQFAMRPLTYWFVGGLFFVAATAWTVKTVREARAGTMHLPKTILIAVTAVVAFLAPAAAARERMEFAFQSVNAWHSIQYMGVVWLVLAMRKQRGLVRDGFLASISGGGKYAWRFYGACAAITIALLVTVKTIAKADPLGISSPQYYYIGVLSCLLQHYALDAWLFAKSGRGEIEEIPYAAPSTPRTSSEDSVEPARAA
ncbi:MAG: hypothetical protein ACXVCJ_18025 [Polyangiales bacterium]